jgi:oligoendopeptidase F
LKTPEKSLEFKQNIDSQFDTVKTKIAELKQEISSTIDSETKTQLTDKLNELTINLNNMKGIHKTYINKFEEGNISADSDI